MSYEPISIIYIVITYKKKKLYNNQLSVILKLKIYFDNREFVCFKDDKIIKILKENILRRIFLRKIFVRE